MSLEAENRSGLNGSRERERSLAWSRKLDGTLENWPLTPPMQILADTCAGSSVHIAKRLRAMCLQSVGGCRLRDLTTHTHPLIYELILLGVLAKRQNREGLGWSIRFTAFTRGWAERALAKSYQTPISIFI